MAPLQRLVSPIQATEQLQIQHFTHQHLLQKLHMTSEFNCDACNIGGYGIRYRCSPCEFDLHEQCAISPQRMNSHLHPHHQLVLVNRPGDSHFCYVCRGLTNGLCYTCECQTCEFDVHPLCTTSLTVDCGQQTGGVSQLGQPVPNTTPHPVLIQHQQQQGIPMMINQQHQPQQDTPTIRSVGGYDGVNHTQPALVNHHHYQQPQQGIRTTAFGGFQGTNGNQHVMMNHGMQQQQQQRIALPAVNGYQGMRTNQEVMINNQQQQRQGLPAVGYNIVNNNQTVMITQPPPPPQYYPQQSSGNASNYENYARMAANLVSTTLIGVPIFNPRN